MRYSLYYWGKECKGGKKTWVRKDFEGAPLEHYTITRGTIIDQYAFKGFLKFDVEVIRVVIHGTQALCGVSFYCVRYKGAKKLRG